MLLADGWSEVDSLDLGEKKEVIFPSLVRFISKYAYYGQATIQGWRKLILNGGGWRYRLMIFIIVLIKHIHVHIHYCHIKYPCKLFKICQIISFVRRLLQ